MKTFMEEYGLIVVSAIVIMLFVVIASPIGNGLSNGVKAVQEKLSAQLGFDESSSDPEAPVGMLPAGAVVTVGDKDRIGAGDLQDGDEVEYGDYVYKYNYKYYPPYGGWYIGSSQNGWGVRVKDSTKSSYGEVCSSLCEKNIVSMSFAFYGCSSLKNAPAIPSSVRNIDYAFSNCSALETAPLIPQNVMSAVSAFNNCTSLTGKVVVNSYNLSSESNANSFFYGTVKEIQLTTDYPGPGMNSPLTYLKNTANNGNVTIVWYMD